MTMRTLDGRDIDLTPDALNGLKARLRRIEHIV
jgi:hypothetical protein